MNLQDAVSIAKTGDCLLFTGAGFSLGARNSAGQEFPTARQFARELAKRLDVDDEYPLDVVAEYAMQDDRPNGLGEHGLARLLGDTFTASAVTPSQDILASAPWRRVYTTNYDLVFESAALNSKIEWTPISTDSTPTALSQRCVHINGHVRDLTVENLKKQIKLTHSSYASDTFVDSQWASQFRADLAVAKAVFFVGYSMADLDIARVMFQAPHLKDKVFFIVRENSPNIETSVLSRYGTVSKIGVDGLADLFKATTAASVSGEHVYSWLIKQEPAQLSDHPSDKDVIALLTLGDIKSQYIASAQADPKVRYTAKRSVLDDVYSEISQGRKWILIHSSLGNGKTVLKHMISHQLMASNYKVYFDSDFEMADDDDVRNLSRTSDRTAVLVDESFNKLETIGKLRAADNSFNVFIVFTRSAIYDLDEARYLAALPFDVRVFDANKLPTTDIASLRSMMDDLGLWGSRSSDDFTKKDEFIKSTCGGEIANVILSIFETTEIGAKLKRSSQRVLQQRGDVSDLITLAFLMENANTPPSLSLISDVLNIDAWAITRSTSFSEANDFIYVRNNEIATRSSIIARFVIRNSLTAEMILSQIARFMERFDKIRVRDKRSLSLFREFQRFSFLEPLVNSPRKRELLIGFYQKIRNLPGCVRNPLFWLQYAIAQMSFERYKDASLYFDSAYSFARADGGVQLRDVDNHYARFLLESRTKTDDWSDHYDAFKEAHGKLYEQMLRGDNRHYPYDRAKLYVPFIASRGHLLSNEQLKLFSSCCNQVKLATKHLTGELSRNARVLECSRAMDRAIEIATERAA